MDNLKFEQVKMTGSEFEDICDLSKIDKKDLPDIFKISKGTLYNYFKAKSVPYEIEEIIDAHDTLRQAKNRVIRIPDTPSVIDQKAIIQSVGEVMKMVLPTMAQSISQAIKETVSEFSGVVKLQMEAREKDYEMIRKSNAAMLETNTMIANNFQMLATHLTGQTQQVGRPHFGPKVKK